MDRFSSHEDATDWDPEHFEAARRARLANAECESAPRVSEIGASGRKSWITGWHDAVMGILADAAVALENGSLPPSRRRTYGTG